MELCDTLVHVKPFLTIIKTNFNDDKQQKLPQKYMK